MSTAMELYREVVRLTELLRDDERDLVQAVEDLISQLGTFRAERDRMKAALDEADKRIEQLDVAGIHTCHAQCQKVPCVLRRERDKLKAMLVAAEHQRDVAERERNRLAAELSKGNAAYEQLLHERDEYREALSFYADHEEWLDFKEIGTDGRGVRRRVNSHFDGDEGRRAREVLNKHADDDAAGGGKK